MPDQDEIIEFMNDPETIKKAVEGSMDKRIANLDQTGRDEVRRAILQVLSESKGNIFNATDLDTMTILESLFGKYADRIEALITQNRQSLIDQIKAEMGEKYDLGQQFADYIAERLSKEEAEKYLIKQGENDMHDKVTKILEGLQ